jgi:hypothetical protein
MRSKLGFPRARERLARKIDGSWFGARVERRWEGRESIAATGFAASDLGEQK